MVKLCKETMGLIDSNYFYCKIDARLSQGISAALT